MRRLVNKSGAIWMVAAILALLSSAVVAQGSVDIRANAAGAPIREFDDPNSGARWLLYASENGGPGRLVLASPTDFVHAEKGTTDPLLPRPVIRAGDRIVLEEHTPVVEARFEAVALGPAVPGGALRVRLAIGGRVIPAIALAPGRAEIPPVQEPQP